MYAILTQTKTGLNWVANEPTLERAKQVANDFTFVDFVLIVPVAAFRDLDGDGAEAQCIDV